jgi:hypothetical protein
MDAKAVVAAWVKIRVPPKRPRREKPTPWARIQVGKISET